MRRALHFATDGADKASCGARVFLCSDYTDDRRHVDCSRCKSTRQFRLYDPARYDVDVWNHEGDVVRSLRDATATEVEAIRDEYDGNPTASVVVTDAAPRGH